MRLANLYAYKQIKYEMTSLFAKLLPYIWDDITRNLIQKRRIPIRRDIPFKNEFNWFIREKNVPYYTLQTQLQGLKIYVWIMDSQKTEKNHIHLSSGNVYCTTTLLDN